jgi:methyltransferase (TIGR00027 family)
MNIEDVSDTARWVAIYRAMETERPDAHFRDPYARRLAGERGEGIVQTMRRGQSMAWPMIVRTAVFDEIILDAVRARGVDLVLNLAAGLDARPWRLDLPESLRWVDVDLPKMVEYKAGVMAGERPRCRYEAIAADLADPAQRDDVLTRAAAGSERALVVTEGLLVYLAPEDVGALAAALAARPAFRWWLTDLASPRLMQMMQKWWGKSVDQGTARFRFAPAEGSAFFARYGWREAAWRSTMEDAQRLKREMRGMWFWRLLGKLQPKRKQEEMRRFAGNLLLERD